MFIKFVKMNNLKYLNFKLGTKCWFSLNISTSISTPLRRFISLRSRPVYVFSVFKRVRDHEKLAQGKIKAFPICALQTAALATQAIKKNKHIFLFAVRTQELVWHLAQAY